MKIATIILAAGKGTRMKSRKPKVLHSICGTPMLLYVLDIGMELMDDSLSNQIIVVLGHQAEQIQEDLKDFLLVSDIQVALQTEQKGTGHAVKQALPYLKPDVSHVLILYGDTPLLSFELIQELIENMGQKQLSLIAADKEDATGYGRVVRESFSGKVLRIVEEKDCTEEERKIQELNAGIYLIDRRFLEHEIAQLTPKNAQNEFYLTDLVAQAAAQGEVGLLKAPLHQVQGVNHRADLAEAEKQMKKNFVSFHMDQGVTFLDPESVYLEQRVFIAEDVEIGPSVCLRGTTFIGKDCKIEAGCVLTNTVVQDGCHVKPYTVATDSFIGPDSQVGPFAHLRPGTRLEKENRVGNFVELKKTTMGEGSKANHLSYLGDAVIGKRVNIGCGTITCNYDGHEKHQTVIEDEVFVGSDTQLVAPVHIGKGAVIAAGTTITENVPTGALAISRVPQSNRLGYREKKQLQRKQQKASESTSI